MPFTKKEPIFALEETGVMHSLWRMDKAGDLARIKNHMRDKKIFIADGHHRYEVALAYRNKMRKKKAFKKSMDYVMMYFSNLSERGNLTILSTHRVAKNIKGFNRQKIRDKLSRYFRIKKAK